MKNVGPLLLMFWRTSPLWAIVSILSRAFRAILPVTIFYVAKLIMDDVVDTLDGRHVEPQRIYLLVLLEFALTAVSDLAARAIVLADSVLGDHFNNWVSIEVMRHAATLDLADFEDPEIADKLQRARQNLMARLEVATQIMTATQNLVTFASLASALVLFSPLLLALLVCSIAPLFFGETHFASQGYSFWRGWTPQRRALEYFSQLAVSSDSASEVKLFGLANYLIERHRDLANTYCLQGRKLAYSRAAFGAALGMFGTLGYYVAYAFILHRTLNGGLSIGDMTFLAASFARSRFLVESVSSGLSRIAEQALYVEDLFSFFRIMPKIHSKPFAHPVPRSIRNGIEFRRVTFRYPGASHNALLDVSFVLRPGERIALVGENGAGKTTIVKLLARLYEPTEGQILLDGIDLRDYDLSAWWGEIGVIFQHFMRYDMLLYENIGLGRVEEMDRRDLIHRAARRSSAHELAARFEAGFDQMIGRRFAGGVGLSGGEWQKIALARAYMREAQILILDEPTAALDARAENDLLDRLKDLTRNKMALLISHRFSTVRTASRILVLHAGRICETGDHDELLKHDGRYAEMFRLQASNYT